MKTLRLFRMAVLISVATVNFVACNNDDNNNHPSIICSNEILELDGVNTSATFTITCTEEWTIETRCDNYGKNLWLSVSPISGGAGTHTITITATPNSRNEKRNSTLSFKTQSEVYSKISMMVTQNSTAQWEDYPVEINDDCTWNERTKVNMTGELNSDDICFIRDLCGTDLYGRSNGKGTLKSLNLADVKIVSGGDFYYCKSGSYHNHGNGNLVPTYVTSTDRDYQKTTLRTILWTPTNTIQPEICIDYCRVGIGEYMFFNCSTLQTITLPKSASNVWANAFDNCNSLREIHVTTSIPPTMKVEADHPFNNECFSQCTLYVPQGSLQNYKNSNGWKEFTNIVEE